MNDKGALQGKVALITGGGTGIGRAIAEAFADAGARVVVCGRRREPLSRVVSAIGGGRAVAVSADVTIAADRTRMLAEARERFGGLDVLVNNAGFSRREPLADISEEDWRTLFDVDATAPILLAREALPLLHARRGSVIQISTGASLRPVRGYGAYGAAKAALNYASLVLALEAAPDVRVNVLCPGGIDTEIFETFLDPEGVSAAKRWFADATPIGRMGRPTEVAACALFLASDAASYVTGAILPVDGGLNTG